MKQTVIFLCALTIFPSIAMAQLAANPWANQSPRNETNAVLSANQNATENSWNIEQPKYVGDKTTWAQPKGQKETAPDVNITNILLMSQHLRNMGYQIPEGLDNAINTAPAWLKKEIWASMKQLHSSPHPVAITSVGFAEIFENRTGFSIENLIGNSLRLIDTRR
ncbi:MAG: hypothetical protein IKV03_01875 [Alphaproteobacteria bacterium]|nr:hypothetical protein [Alphaproteobacteria bacterium]